LIGIWVVNDPSITWDVFALSLNSFGQRRWDIFKLSNLIDYLDLTITIHNRRIITRTYQKEKEAIPIPASPFSSPSLEAKGNYLQSHAYVLQTEYLSARLQITVI
jgi:hypothetical protein